MADQRQIAAAAGATVIATSSSDEKLEVARKLGATHLINYKTTPEWSKKVLELTNGVGVDIVVDVVGADMIEETVQAVRFGGRVSYMGMLSKEPNAPKAIFQTLLFKAITSMCLHFVETPMSQADAVQSKESWVLEVVR